MAEKKHSTRGGRGTRWRKPVPIADATMPGVTVARGEAFTNYRGRVDDVVASGLVARQEIPGERGCPHKTRHRVARGDNQLTIRRCGNVVHVTHYLSDAGLGAAEARAEIAKLPTDRAQVRSAITAEVDVTLRSAFACICRDRAGFKYSDEVLEEFSSLCHELVDLARDGAIGFSVARRNAAIVALGIDAAQADDGFQAFLRVAGAKGDTPL